MAYTYPNNNECTTNISGVPLHFSFEYDDDTGKLGCLDSNGDFYPFNSGGGGSGIDTSDATAGPNNIQLGYTAYAKGKKIVGRATVVAPPSQGSIAKYSGNINVLSKARMGLAGTNTGNYILFAGGQYSAYDDRSNVVDAYDGYSLTRSIPTPLSESKYHVAGVNLANYALFGGGYLGANITASITLETYDSSLTRTVYSNYASYYLYDRSAATVGNYALFAGGACYNYGLGQLQYFNYTDAYDNSFTFSKITSLSETKYTHAAASNPLYAIFAGGYHGGSYMSPSVDAYDSTLVRSNPTSLSVGRMYLRATNIGDYALFAGGGNSSALNTVDAYDSSLIRSTPTALSQARQEFGATTLGDYALFGGGTVWNNSTYYTNVDTYNLSLTRSTAAPLSVGSRNLAAGAAGYYAIFAGGANTASANIYYNNVDAYYIA